MKQTSNEQLVKLAARAMRKSYSPYSNFKVGAALLTDDGTVYEGCNIENAAYSPSICAERVAVFTAVRDGHRKFAKIAVVGGQNGVISSYTTPCGVCRQVMREFCADDFVILLYDGENIRETTLGALLPESFSPSDIFRQTI